MGHLTNRTVTGYFLSGPIPASFSWISSFQQLTKYTYITKYCRRLDSNHGPLVLEATALPTEPQPLFRGYFYSIFILCKLTYSSSFIQIPTFRLLYFFSFWTRIFLINFFLLWSVFAFTLPPIVFFFRQVCYQPSSASVLSLPLPLELSLFSFLCPCFISTLRFL